MAFRVLLVQTDQKAARKLERMFNSRRDRIWIASDLIQAASLFAQEKPDLILSDMHFPLSEWSGFLRSIKQTSPDVKIIPTSLYPDLHREIIARQYGVKIFLRQPFEKRWLKLALSAVQKGVEPAFEPPLSWKTRIPVSIRVSFPFLLVALAIAIVSGVLVSRAYSYQYRQGFDQFVARSQEVGVEWSITARLSMLEHLKRICESPEILKAVAAQDSEQVRRIVYPLLMDAEAEAAVVTGPSGKIILAMSPPEGSKPGQYRYGEKENAQLLGSIRNLFLDPDDEMKDGAAWSIAGGHIIVGRSITGANGRLVGHVFLGKNLASMIDSLQTAAGTEVSIYTPDGQPAASSLFSDVESFPLGSNLTGLIFQAPAEDYARILNIDGIEYTEFLSPWISVEGEFIGLLGQGYSHSVLVREGRFSRSQVFGFTTGVILILIAAAGFFARKITNPIKPLVEASSRIALGDLAVRVYAGGDDDTAAIGHSINRMAASLQEGLLYRDLLGRSVKPAVREQIRANLQSGELRLDGREAVITVLVVEIHNLIDLVEGIAPPDVFERLGRYYNSIVPVIEKNGGCIDRLDGQTMQVSFGFLPDCMSPAESAQAACRTALEMIRQVDELNDRCIKVGLPDFRIGIGIHTGRVIVGGLESAGKVRLSMLGNVVGDAYRVVTGNYSRSDNGDIWLTQSTVTALGEMAGYYSMEIQARQPGFDMNIYRIILPGNLTALSSQPSENCNEKNYIQPEKEL